MTTSPNDDDVIGGWMSYEEALEIVFSMMDAPAGSQAERRLDEVVTQIERYEQRHYPMDEPIEEQANDDQPE